MPPRENPFRHMGQWYWYDEAELMHGPYQTERQAVRALLRYTAFLESGPSVLSDLREWGGNSWDRFKQLLSEFVHS